MEAVFVGSVGWTWNLTISSAGLNEVDLGRLSSITSSLSMVARSVVNSSAARASDNASRASAAIFFWRKVRRLHQGLTVPRWKLFYWGPLDGPGI